MTDPQAGNGTNSGSSVDVTQFAADIFNALIADQPEQNILISPLLLEANLALLYLGADGATADDLCKILLLKKRFANNAKMANYYATNYAALVASNANPPISGASSQDAKLMLSNRIYVHEKFAIAEEFVKIAQKYFHSTAEKLCDLGKINEALEVALSVVSSSLQGSMENIGVENNNEVVALLLAAANFKYKWFLPFSAYRSGLYDFHSCGSSESKATAMLFDDDMFVKFGEFKELDARAIELPCEHEQEDICMLLLLPNKRDGLKDMLQKMGNLDLAVLSERMQMESVQVLLPKFNIDFECCLRTQLENIGLSSLFSSAANFKNLLQENSNQQFQLGNLLHKSVLGVHESGSEASATAAALKPIVISNSRQKFFRADHPFYFAVRNLNTTLFVGQVVKP